MLRLNAKNGYFVCRKLKTSSGQAPDSKFLYTEETMPEYEVLDVAPDVPDDIQIIPGDKIIVNSTGTKVSLNESEIYLFNYENVVGKISN